MFKDAIATQVWSVFGYENCLSLMYRLEQKRTDQYWLRATSWNLNITVILTQQDTQFLTLCLWIMHVLACEHMTCAVPNCPFWKAPHFICPMLLPYQNSSCFFNYQSYLSLYSVLCKLYLAMVFDMKLSRSNEAHCGQNSLSHIVTDMQDQPCASAAKLKTTVSMTAIALSKV